MDVSFLLATLEVPSHGSNLEKVIHSIYQQETKYSYEICIYSPHEIKGQHIRWVKEENMLGPIYGYNYLCKHGSSGEYMIGIVDDHMFMTPFDFAIDKIRSEQYKDRKFKICSLSTGAGHVEPLPLEGARFGSILSVKDSGWPKGNTMRFPVMDRSTLNNLLDGYWFHPECRYHAGDIWLGCYLSFMDEPGLECFESRIQSLPGRGKNFDWEVVDANTVYALVKGWHSGGRDYVSPERPMQSPTRYHLIRDGRTYVQGYPE